MTALAMPYPHIAKGRFSSLDAWSDESLAQQVGVRIAFTTRQGGVSEGAYASLNLADHVGDNPAAVQENRTRLMSAFGASDFDVLVPHQVHGSTVVEVDDRTSFTFARQQARAGADALVVDMPHVAALLCFADCVPLIAVGPTGAFAVIHAGWRGVENEIAVAAVHKLAAAVARKQDVSLQDALGVINVYLGPYIHAECFETGPDVHRLFAEKFGPTCVYDASRINLGQALRIQLVRSGICEDRIADVGLCTVCENQMFFSFRAQSGNAGRHGALAFRQD